ALQVDLTELLLLITVQLLPGADLRGVTGWDDACISRQRGTEIGFFHLDAVHALFRVDLIEQVERSRTLVQVAELDLRITDEQASHPSRQIGEDAHHTLLNVEITMRQLRLYILNREIAGLAQVELRILSTARGLVLGGCKATGKCRQQGGKAGDDC